jgi:hypothetical protein
MQKAILQQQVMDPLMKWAGLGISQWFSQGNAPAGSSVVGGTVTPGAQGMAVGSGISSSIVINNNGGSGATSDVKTSGVGGAAMGRELEAAVNAILIKNQRPGGILTRTA